MGNPPATLASLLRKSRDGIRLSEHLVSADRDLVFQHASAMGLEGIVAKRRDQPYGARRTGSIESTRLRIWGSGVRISSGAPMKSSTWSEFRSENLPQKLALGRSWADCEVMLGRAARIFMAE